MLSNFAIFGLGTGLSVLIWIVLALIFVFEIWMFVSALTNKGISNAAKAWWIVGMILLHPIIAIIYYFTDYKKAA